MKHYKFWIEDVKMYIFWRFYRYDTNILKIRDLDGLQAAPVNAKGEFLYKPVLLFRPWLLSLMRSWAVVAQFAKYGHIDESTKRIYYLPKQNQNKNLNGIASKTEPTKIQIYGYFSKNNMLR